jgi:hypothetical protein
MAVDRLFDFLGELQKLGVHYRIESDTAPEFGAGYRSLTLHVTASASEVWEVDFHDDGTVDVERFVSTGIEEAHADLDSLLAELRSDSNDSTVS